MKKDTIIDLLIILIGLLFISILVLSVLYITQIKKSNNNTLNTIIQPTSNVPPSTPNILSSPQYAQKQLMGCVQLNNMYRGSLNIPSDSWETDDRQTAIDIINKQHPTLSKDVLSKMTNSGLYELLSHYCV
jgi:hypothetical protein